MYKLLRSIGLIEKGNVVEWSEKLQGYAVPGAVHFPLSRKAVEDNPNLFEPVNKLRRVVIDENFLHSKVSQEQKVFHILRAMPHLQGSANYKELQESFEAWTDEPIKFTSLERYSRNYSNQNRFN